MKFKCVKCGEPFNPAAIMGAIGRGDSKRRTPEQARKAARARWGKKKGATGKSG
jgi:hypothetical protein